MERIIRDRALADMAVGEIRVTGLSRRQIFKMMGMTAAGAMVAPFSLYNAPAAFGDAAASGYGPLHPKVPLNGAKLTDTIVGDLSRSTLLDLPAGFEYTALSITGETMNDGKPVPGRHDGMACFSAPNGGTVLIRNHELSPGPDEFGNSAGVDAPPGKSWDNAATGGATSLLVGGDGRLVRHFGVLGGTLRNCAGGVTPWGSWISCEESVKVPSRHNGLKRKHGYNFEIPAAARGFVEPIPLTAMGRFNHEATATDPRTGHVFQTEDRGDSAFYRFRPTQYGKLRAGVLEAMVIDDRRLSRDANGAADTRSGVLSLRNKPLSVRWVPIEDVDPASDTVRDEAHAKGAALFARGEGACAVNGLIYFVCTSGGDDGNGQVWAHDPAASTVTLVVESVARSELDNPDNITVSPDGSLYLCEDGDGEQFVVGVTPRGGLFKFARNSIRRPDRGGTADNTEFAGACFSQNGRHMFLNNQSIGITYCIWGPWDRLR